MLMEEMAKTEVKMEAESTDPQPPDVLAVTSAVTPDTSAAPTISHQRTRYISITANIIVSLIILQRRTAPENFTTGFIFIPIQFNLRCVLKPLHYNDSPAAMCVTLVTMILWKFIIRRIDGTPISVTNPSEPPLDVICQTFIF